MTTSRLEQIAQLENEWKNHAEGITRPYTAEEVIKLRGSVAEHTLAVKVPNAFGHS